MLVKVEWFGGVFLLQGCCLLFGYYFNELLFKLLLCEDVYLVLFLVYVQVLVVLVQGVGDVFELCCFEKILLKELGYGFILDQEVDSGVVVEQGCEYFYLVECGLVFVGEWGFEKFGVLVVCGKILFDLVVDDYCDLCILVESKLLMC